EDRRRAQARGHRDLRGAGQEAHRRRPPEHLQARGDGDQGPRPALVRLTRDEARRPHPLPPRLPRPPPHLRPREAALDAGLVLVPGRPLPGDRPRRGAAVQGAGREVPGHRGGRAGGREKAGRAGMTARFIVADVFDGLAGIEDGSVDLVVTSPPFLALRSYLPADHPDKGKEIGSEATPAEFLDTLLAVTAELRRVLAPHGSICVELGDSYAGGSSDGTDQLGNERYPTGRGMEKGGMQPKNGAGWPLPKSKALVPELYRIALAYGINARTGQESPAGRWRIRNVVTWCRPNPPVGFLGDKWRPATSDIVVACTSDKRYWDDIATRRPHTRPDEKMRRLGRQNGTVGDPNAGGGRLGDYDAATQSPAGAPLLDWWEIAPGGYHGAHYAVYPPALIEPLIKA